MRDTGLTHGGFYKHFESKDELLLESLREAFQESADKLTAVVERSGTEEPWKTIVKAYLSLEYCHHIEQGCPLPALAPEMARADSGMRRKGETLQRTGRSLASASRHAHSRSVFPA